MHLELFFFPVLLLAFGLLLRACFRRTMIRKVRPWAIVTQETGTSVLGTEWRQLCLPVFRLDGSPSFAEVNRILFSDRVSLNSQLEFDMQRSGSSTRSSIDHMLPSSDDDFDSLFKRRRSGRHCRR